MNILFDIVLCKRWLIDMRILATKGVLIVSVSLALSDLISHSFLGLCFCVFRLAISRHATHSLPFLVGILCIRHMI